MAERMFVHVLLFECPQCGSPIELMVSSPCSNPEELDGREFNLRCNCNWTGKSQGFTAKRRVMVAWDTPEESLDPDTYLMGSAVGSVIGGCRRMRHDLKTEPGALRSACWFW
jgi:hypothetical protein